MSSEFYFWFAFVFTSILFTALILCAALILDDQDKLGGCIRLVIVSIIVLILLAFGYITKDEDKPTALDVYRGNTELQVTYRDTVPIDSAVVFKIPPRDL